MFLSKMRLNSHLPLCSSKQLAQIKAHVFTSSQPHALNTLLDSFINSHTPQFAFALYNQMLEKPITHNHFTFNFILRACCSTNSIIKGQEIHAHVIKTGNFSYTYIQNSVIHLYVIGNNIDYAYRVFEKIDCPNVVSWTSIISGFSKCGFEDRAISMFSAMNVDPSANTLVSVLSACSSLGELKLGKCVHCYSLKRFDENDVILDTALLNFYIKVGAFENACQLFDKMPKRDVVSWSAMVGGLVQMGLYQKAVDLFHEMVKEGKVKPNKATVVNVLAACSSLGSLSLCESVHSFVQERSYIPVEGMVGNAFINVYAKCGCIMSAIHVFNELRYKDTISWSTMINGLAMNGLVHRVLPLFGRMLVHGVALDDVTFISLLTACSHGGLVDDGLRLFKAMVNTYGITCNVRHCACVVDLYARAGRFREAEKFIMDMDIEPDGPVWSALASACRVHGNEMSLRRVSKTLVEKGATGGALSSVSNTYASLNRWDESMEIRDVIGSLGLEKKAGCSWIEL